MDPFTLAAVGGVGNAIGGIFGASSKRKAEERARRQQLAAIQEATDARNSLIAQTQDGNYLGQYGLEDMYGGKLDELNLGQSQLGAIFANQSNLDEISEFTRLANEGISNEAMQRALDFDPNFGANIATISDSTRSLLRGEIPEDVSRELYRQGAEGSTILGTGGAATSRDLGLTSLDLQNQGMGNFQQLLDINDQVDPISRYISQQSFMVDPAAQLAVDEANNQIRNQATPGVAQLFGLDLQGQTSDAYAKAGVQQPTASPTASFFNGVGSVASGLGGFFQQQDRNNDLSSIAASLKGLF